MPRKKIPFAVFDHPPEFLHEITINERLYWLLDAVPCAGKDGRPGYVLSWVTNCTVCETLFVVESGLAVYRLYRRCKRHQRQTPQMQKARIKGAMRSLKKCFR
jgi:hypothetical protein